MVRQANAAPVIIKRKKVVQGGGHHGGAWKVAYADFVTAMMAFFMLMWLLNATTEKQRKGLADYFSPTIPISRISGGGSGAFGAESVFSDAAMAFNGSAAASAAAMAEAEGAASAGAGGEVAFREIEKALSARGGESMTMQQLLRHVVTRVTDEGLVIEIFDLEEVPLFDASTDRPLPVLRDIAALLVEVLGLTANKVAVDGHVRSYPITLIDNPVWALSAARAQAMRGLLGTAGLPDARVQRVSGHADRMPATPDPTVARNNRLEVILLRRDR